MAVKSPGSFKEYAEGYYLDMDKSALGLYTLALMAYRHSIAEEEGISEEDMHYKQAPQSALSPNTDAMSNQQER